MVTKYQNEVSDKTILINIERITNLTFKLLPLREEGGDWETPLQNLIVEIAGMSELFPEQIELLKLMSKMEGILRISKDDFMLFRKTIFECLGILNKVKKCLVD